MTEVLSQNEIDQLLSAMSQGESEEAAPVAAADSRKIKIYDFKRPDKFSKEQIRTISMMHETFARLASTALSAHLRSLVQVHVASVDQLTYEEFIRSIPSPTTLANVSMDPLKGAALLEIDPALSSAIIDRVFGGKGEGAKAARELTDIETSVMEGMVVRLLGNLREAWQQVIDLRPRLSNIETNPQFAQIVPQTEMVVLVTLETRIGEVEGMVNLCFPYLTLEAIVSKLSAQFMYSSVRRGMTAENLGVLKGTLEEAAVPVVAECGRTRLRARDILSMRVGDVLRLESAKAADPLVLSVGDKTKFLCRPGLVGRKVAVCIVAKVADEGGAEELAEEL